MRQQEKIGFIKMFTTAVAKPREYKNILQVKKRTVILYILIVSFLLTFLGTAMPILGFMASIGGPKHFIMDTLPQFQYQDGKFSIEQRVEINDGGVRIIADDDVKNFKEKDFDEEALVEVLISRENMRIKNTAAKQNVEFKFADFGKGTFDNKGLVGMLPIFYAGAVFGLGLLFGYTIVGYLFSACIFAFCGKSFGRMMGKEISYKQTFLFAIMARTTAGILNSMGTAADLAFFQSVTWIFVEFVIVLVYLYIGIGSMVKGD